MFDELVSIGAHGTKENLIDFFKENKSITIGYKGDSCFFSACENENIEVLNYIVEQRVLKNPNLKEPHLLHRNVEMLISNGIKYCTHNNKLKSLETLLYSPNTTTVFRQSFFKMIFNNALIYDYPELMNYVLNKVEQKEMDFSISFLFLLSDFSRGVSQDKKSEKTLPLFLESNIFKELFEKNKYSNMLMDDLIMKQHYTGLAVIVNKFRKHIELNNNLSKLLFKASVANEDNSAFINFITNEIIVTKEDIRKYEKIALKTYPGYTNLIENCVSHIIKIYESKELGDKLENLLIKKEKVQEKTNKIKI